MQSRTGRYTKASDIPSVRRNLRFDQDDIKHSQAKDGSPSRPSKKSDAQRCVPTKLFAEAIRDEFFQLHDVGREFADAFRGLLSGHRVLVQTPPEFPLVQFKPLNVGLLRFSRIEFSLNRL